MSFDVCVALCFEMVLRLFNGAIMRRNYLAPLNFVRSTINLVSSINKQVIMVF